MSMASTIIVPNLLKKNQTHHHDKSKKSKGWAGVIQSEQLHESAVDKQQPAAPRLTLLVVRYRKETEYGTLKYSSRLLKNSVGC
jgi:hypothetical protein